MPRTSGANHALQRTPGFGVQLPGGALTRPAQSQAVRPAMKPGTARAFALRRSAHTPRSRPGVAELGVVRRMNAQSELDKWIGEIKSSNHMTFEEAYHGTRPTGPLVISRLVAEMHGASDAYTRGKFIELLGEMGDATLIPDLSGELGHPDRAVRDWAVTALKTIGGESAERAIREYEAAHRE